MSTATRTLRRGHAATSRRADAVPKVTGEFAYSSDLHAAGMLWGHTVRSPHAHARVLAIDATEARAMPGVHAVLTHDDVPGQKTYGLEFADQPVLASDRVRYFGEAVAIVAAEEPEQARRAAAAVRVEYEPLEPVTDPERATEMEPLHPDRPTMGHGYRDDPRPNVVRSLVIRRGDPDAPADVTVEGMYDVGQQDQAFLGPESGIAIPDGEGGVDIHVATQWLHVDRDQVAPCLGTRSGAGADPPRGRRRGVRRARGPLHADPRGAARAAHRPAGEDRLQPRGVVRRPHPPPSRADLGRAPRDAGRPARLGAHADPRRRRRVRLQLDRRHLERVLVRASARTPSTTSRSTGSRCTRTTRPAGRCAASERCRPASPPRRRWTSSPPRSTSIRSSCDC